MKVASLVVFVAFGALAACKPSSSNKPASSTGSAEQAPAARANSPSAQQPSLPDEAAEGSDTEASEHHSRLDTNGDGVISPEERAAARAQRAKRVHDRYDANHDGKLTPDELAAAASNHRGPRFDDPAELDTNHDGDISADELQAGMREWRVEQRLHMLRGSGDPAGAGSDASGSSAE